MSFTKSCQVAPLLAVGRNGILVRGFGGQIPPTEQTASFEGQVEAERAMSAECPPALKAPPQAAGIFTRFSSLCKTSVVCLRCYRWPSVYKMICKALRRVN